MFVTRAHVLEVAALARLRLTDEEAELFTAQLETILEHVAELETAEVGALDDADLDAPGDHVPLRADEPAADLLHLPVSAIAPDMNDGFFTVPRLQAMAGSNDAPEA